MTLLLVMNLGFGYTGALVVHGGPLTLLLMMNLGFGCGGAIVPTFNPAWAANLNTTLATPVRQPEQP